MSDETGRPDVTGEVDRLIFLVGEATRAEASGCASAAQLRVLNKRVAKYRQRVLSAFEKKDRS